MVNSVELLRAYLEVTGTASGRFAGEHELQLGRMTMDFGSRRLVARNRFRNTSNAFTGVAWTWKGVRDHTLRAFYVLPLKRRPTSRSLGGIGV